MALTQQAMTCCFSVPVYRLDLVISRAILVSGAVILLLFDPLTSSGSVGTASVWQRERGGEKFILGYRIGMPMFLMD